MKTQIHNMEPQQAESRNLDALILHEQLALKRLRELRREIRASSARQRKLNKLWRAILGSGQVVWSALLKQPALTHQTAPGQPPVEWHAHERARELHALRIL